MKILDYDTKSIIYKIMKKNMIFDDIDNVHILYDENVIQLMYNQIILRKWNIRHDSSVIDCYFSPNTRIILNTFDEAILEGFVGGNYENIN